MLCDECKKNQASYHSIKKINGITSEKHLCSDCYEKDSAGNNSFSGLGEFFSGFKSFFELPQRRNVLVCSKCGITSDEFLDSGLVGCGNCYTDLGQVIMPVIKKVQKDIRHLGKSPAGAAPDSGKEYERLSRELKKAIEIEDFENATIIRDKMREIKGE